MAAVAAKVTELSCDLIVGLDPSVGLARIIDSEIGRTELAIAVGHDDVIRRAACNSVI